MPDAAHPSDGELATAILNGLDIIGFLIDADLTIVCDCLRRAFVNDLLEVLRKAFIKRIGHGKRRIVEIVAQFCHIALNLVESVDAGDRIGVILAVNRFLLQSSIELGERHRRGRSAHFGKHLNVHWGFHHADLQALHIVGASDRVLAVCQLTHAVFKLAEDSDAGLITDLLTDALTHFAVDKVKRRITVVKQKREADKHIFFRKAGKGTRRGVCHLDFVGLQAFQHGPAVAERIVNVNVKPESGRWNALQPAL